MAAFFSALASIFVDFAYLMAGLVIGAYKIATTEIAMGLFYSVLVLFSLAIVGIGATWLGDWSERRNSIRGKKS